MISVVVANEEVVRASRTGQQTRELTSFSSSAPNTDDRRAVALAQIR